MVNIKVLAIGAHGDDLELSCFGTLAKHIQSGDSVHCLILSRGGLSRDHTDLSLVQEILGNIKQSMKLLGATYTVLDFPDQQFDVVPQIKINKAIEAEIKKTQAEVVYVHTKNCLNRDHIITHDATMVACRPVNTTVKEVYCFEVLSATEWSVDVFDPRLFIDITSVLPLKVEASMIYCNEMREYPHSRSKEGIEYLARARGIQSGLEASEAFEVIRMIRGTK